MISCKRCQQLVVGYIHHELSPKQKRRVAEHLDHCESCYALYLGHKRVANELRHDIPLVGDGRPPSFDRVWTAVRIDAARRTSNYYPLRYGMAMIAITLLLLIPFALGRTNQVLAEPPTQPAPLIRVTPNSTVATEEGIAVAYEISQTPAPAKIPVTLHLDVVSTP
jgi:predicted anti-sigma-YlaC factor YlaD